MSRWTHSVCEECYRKLMPGCEPRVIEAPVELCCACGERQAGGIYYRADPASLACRGQHDETPEAA